MLTALKQGDLQEAEYLINCCVLVDEVDGWGMYPGWTPLMYAADKGLNDIVNVILLRRPDVDRLSTRGRCALYLAAMRGHRAICEALLAAKANADIVCGGKTPAQCALAEGHKELAALIERVCI